MNYETMPAQIKCTRCRTIQDASHKYCKECGISFREGKTPRSIFEQADDLRQKEWDQDIERWKESEKRYFIPPVTSDQTKIPLITSTAMPGDILLCKTTSADMPFKAGDTACISTSPEASREMARRFHESCGCKSHISDVFSKVKFEDIIPKE